MKSTKDLCNSFFLREKPKINKGQRRRSRSLPLTFSEGSNAAAVFVSNGQWRDGEAIPGFLESTLSVHVFVSSLDLNLLFISSSFFIERLWIND